jgi:hypothetical protein
MGLASFVLKERRGSPMKINNNSDLIGYVLVALIASMFVYHLWRYILGALALFGLGYIIREWHRNDRNNKGPRS